MGARRKKTVLKTIRMTEDVSSTIERDAEKKNTTVNGLISAILTKYVEWDRFAENFDFIPFSRGFLKSILQAADEAKLMELAEEQARIGMREAIRFWYTKVDVDSFVSWMALQSKYGGFSKSEIRSDGRNYSILIDHGLGGPWSKFSERWVKRGMVNSLGISPKIETTENSIIIEFSRS